MSPAVFVKKVRKTASQVQCTCTNAGSGVVTCCSNWYQIGARSRNNNYSYPIRRNYTIRNNYYSHYTWSGYMWFSRLVLEPWVLVM